MSNQLNSKMSVQPKIDPFGRKEVTVLSSLHKFKYMYSM